MKVVPYTWHSREHLQQLETSVKLELHAIIREHGSNSDEFWEKHAELVQIQEALYLKPENQLAHA